jgi:Flp pilus assembly secretin CpaC
MSAPCSIRYRRALPAAFLAALLAALSLSARPQTPAASSAAVKPDLRKAREAFRLGQDAEQRQNWQNAYDSYSDAVAWAPANKGYALRREIAKGALVQAKVNAAERDAISGDMEGARRELFSASYLDPTNAIVRERLSQLIAAQTSAPAAAPLLGGELRLQYQTGNRNFDYQGDTRGAYDEIARQFGVEDSFDADLRTIPVHLVLTDADFMTAMRVLGQMTHTFWRPLTRRLLFVADDTTQKRRDYGESAVRTVQLAASETPDQMAETLRVIRDVSGVTRTTLNTSSRTITMRASPQAIAVATDLIDNIEQAPGEMVLEMEILEVDRSYARNLGITPPQTITAYALSPQEIQAASQSSSNLVAIIQQIFGLPASLSGLSNSQLAGLLSSGQLSAASLVPPLIAFGGGESTFLSTLPGATANFSRMLSLVKHGQRILLRADDGKPATFFVGEHFPVSLANYSSSFGGTTIPGVSSTEFPVVNYPVGNAPQFVTSTILRASSAINDLIVANESDGTMGVLLGNGVTQGDGTFADEVTYPTDPATSGSAPVWITTADFNSDGHTDLLVANRNSNNVGLLLGSTAGDGTFQAATTIATGAAPVSVVSALFHDATTSSHVDFAVANQNDNSISVFQGNGDGTFVTPATVLQLPAGYAPAGLAAVDVNADGHADLIVADRGNNSVSVFLSNGDGTFQPRSDYATGNSPVFVASGDFNADGAVDLAVANNGPSTTNNSGDSVTILLGQKNTSGTPTGAFAPGAQRDFPAGKAPTGIAVGDFNIDGLPDLIVTDGVDSTGDSGDNAVSALLGAGDGTFSSNVELSVGTNPQSITAADFNGDGKLDVATANNGSNNVSVILNSTSIFGGGLESGTTGTPYPNVQYIDLGLKVKATPRIHSDGEVTLQLEFNITSLASQTFNTIPVVANQSLTQTVRLKEGETSTIAGFLSAQTSTNANGTPGFVGLPGLQWLAQDQTKADQDTELLFLVTPRMVRFADRKDRMIYAGQGALEGPGAPPTAIPPAAPTPPQQPLRPIPGQPPITPAGQAPGAAQAPGQVPGQLPPAQVPPGQGQPNPFQQPGTPDQQQTQPNPQQPAPAQPNP